MEMSKNFRTGINDQSEKYIGRNFYSMESYLKYTKERELISVAHTYAGLAQTLRWKFLK